MNGTGRGTGRWRRLCGLAVLSVLLGLPARTQAAVDTGPVAQAPKRALLAIPQFRDYGYQDGMPDAGGYMAVQDRQGFIWVGTRDGLVRYDGLHFRIFRHDTSDPHSLPSNDIDAVLVDRQGGIWAGGEGTGLLHYIPGYGFKRWVHKPGDPHSLGANDVFALAQTPDGAIWVGTYAGGLARLAPDGRITRVRHRKDDPGSLVSDTIMGLHVTPDGSLWISTLQGVDVLRPDGRLQHVRFPGGRRVAAFSITGQGASLRVASMQGVFLIQDDPADPSVFPHGVLLPGGEGACFSSATDAAGGLWLGCANGLRYRDAAGRWALFTPQPQLRDGLPAGRIVGMLRDREGGMWFVSKGGPLAYLPPDWRAFSLFRHTPDDPDSLPFGSFDAICKGGEESILLGNEKGWAGRLDPATGAVQRLSLPWKGSIDIGALTEDAQGRLWVANSYKLAVRMTDGQWQRIALPWKLSPGAAIKALVLDGRGGLYVASVEDGVVRIDLRTLKTSVVPTPAHRVSDQETEDLALRDGVLWRATPGGLERIDAAGALREVPGVAPGMVHAVAFDQAGFWLARKGRLESYRLDSRGVAHLRATIEARQGWPGARVLALTVDAAGNVWASTLRGLMRFDPHDDRVDRFEDVPALSGLRASAVGFVHGADGSLFTAVSEGLLGFEPLRRMAPIPAPTPVLTQIQAAGEGVRQPLQPVDGTIRLGWRMRELSVTARALSYLSPARVRYRFRLQPWTREWLTAGNDGLQNFGRLDPGRYTLELQAQAMPGGPWGEAQPLRVVVAAPPWSRWWARTAYALLVLGLAIALMHLWRRRIEQQQRVLLAEERRQVAEQASASKTRFLAELGHEIRTPMTGVLGMSELLLGTHLDARQHSYVEAIARSGGLLQKLVNDALDLARIEAGRMRLEIEPYDPVLLVYELADSERPLAAAKGLGFRVDMEPALLPHRVLGDVMRIKQILFNLLGNALKFTQQGEVRLGLVQLGGSLRFTVSDTGPGIEPGLRTRLFQRYEQADGPQRAAGSGLGLAISRELAELMGGSLELDSEPGHGSRFTLKLPARSAPVRGTTQDSAATRAARPLQLALVEDDPTVVAVLQGMLEAQGHVVRHAADGLAALALLEDLQPDALLLDLDLPGVDGFAVARMLRAREAPGTHLPILAISARSGGDEAELALAAGMDGFLRKPITGAVLAVALADLVDRRQSAAGDAGLVADAGSDMSTKREEGA